MNIIAIIQARIESTRLPGKVLTPICQKPVLWHIYHRVKKCSLINNVVIATSLNKADDVIHKFAIENEIKVYRGSHHDVLERYYQCATIEKADIIIRFTGDNVLIDWNIIEEGILEFINNNYDYIRYREGLPLGMEIEVFSYDTLKKAHLESNSEECREHVTPYIYRNPDIFKVKYYPCIGDDNSNLRWTLDTQQDLSLVSEIYESLYYNNPYFGYREILNEYRKHPCWYSINQMIQQKEVTYKKV